MTNRSNTKAAILSAAAQLEDRDVLPLPGGIEPDDADTGPRDATDAPTEARAPDAPTEPDPAPKARTPRTGTKQAILIAMLRAEGGATIEEIAAATGWQSHTVRGAMAGALKKKLGLEVTSEKVEGRGRTYRICSAQHEL
jgi:hypothetical protein